MRAGGKPPMKTGCQRCTEPYAKAHLENGSRRSLFPSDALRKSGGWIDVFLLVVARKRAKSCTRSHPLKCCSLRCYPSNVGWCYPKKPPVLQLPAVFSYSNSFEIGDLIKSKEKGAFRKRKAPFVMRCLNYASSAKYLMVRTI